MEKTGGGGREVKQLFHCGEIMSQIHKLQQVDFILQTVIYNERLQHYLNNCIIMKKFQAITHEAAQLQTKWK